MKGIDRKWIQKYIWQMMMTKSWAISAYDFTAENSVHFDFHYDSVRVFVNIVKLFSGFLLCSMHAGYTRFDISVDQKLYYIVCFDDVLVKWLFLHCVGQEFFLSFQPTPKRASKYISFCYFATSHTPPLACLLLLFLYFVVVSRCCRLPLCLSLAHSRAQCAVFSVLSIQIGAEFLNVNILLFYGIVWVCVLHYFFASFNFFLFFFFNTLLLLLWKRRISPKWIIFFCTNIDSSQHRRLTT